MNWKTGFIFLLFYFMFETTNDGEFDFKKYQEKSSFLVSVHG